MEKWVIVAKRADFNQIGQQFHIDPVIARLIRNRDVIGEDKIREYLSGTVQELPSPWLMKDMEKAVDILEKKISQKAKVRIIGDYDIDGVTSTYILMKGLARIGADVDTYIPDRVADGYGIHAHLIERAETDRIDTIVTCDNGIAAAAEIQIRNNRIVHTRRQTCVGQWWPLNILQHFTRDLVFQKRIWKIIMNWRLLQQ